MLYSVCFQTKLSKCTAAKAKSQDVSLFQSTGSYDSVSSYDSYNQRLGLGPNAHDDLKSCNGTGPANGTGTSQRQPGPPGPPGHDPYRFTRSTQQPISPKPSLDPPLKPAKPPDYPKYR